MEITYQYTGRDKVEESECLDAYMESLQDCIPLSYKSEVELFKKAQLGDEVARQNLIKANLRFVVKIAKEYRKQGVPFADLIAEGNVGLLKALDYYDETRGVRFITYAVWWIRQSIQEMLWEQQCIVRPCRGTVHLQRKVNRHIRALEQELGRSPDLSDISRRSQLSCVELDELLSESQVDCELEEDITSSRPDMGYKSPDEIMDEMEAHDLLDQVLGALNWRHAWVLRAYYGLGGREAMTLEQIGQMLGGLTRERVRQIRNAALAKLRVQMGPLVLDEAA